MEERWIGTGNEWMKMEGRTQKERERESKKEREKEIERKRVH